VHRHCSWIVNRRAHVVHRHCSWIVNRPYAPCSFHLSLHLLVIALSPSSTTFTSLRVLALAAASSVVPSTASSPWPPPHWRHPPPTTCPASHCSLIRSRYLNLSCSHLENVDRLALDRSSAAASEAGSRSAAQWPRPTRLTPLTFQPKTGEHGPYLPDLAISRCGVRKACPVSSRQAVHSSRFCMPAHTTVASLPFHAYCQSFFRPAQPWRPPLQRQHRRLGTGLWLAHSRHLDTQHPTPSTLRHPLPPVLWWIRGSHCRFAHPRSRLTLFSATVG
jgi:hypothetical protein